MAHDRFEPALAERTADRLQSEIARTATLQAAAQHWVEGIDAALPGAFALVRMYAVVPVKKLGEVEKRFANTFAEKNKLALGDDTLVLTLLGTRGVEHAWQHRERSQGHLAIPLVSAQFVQGAPMVARLLTDFGVGVSWIDTRDPSVVVSKLGSSLGTFYVKDAATEKDAEGRAVVPAQDFVAKYGVKTVFGFGGAFLDGTLVSLILFARERLEPADVRALMPLQSRFLGATFSMVLSGKLLN